VFNAILIVLGSLLQYGDYFAWFRVSSDLRLLEDGLAIADDFETPALRRNESDLRIGKAATNFRRQTGSARFVASNSAVFDADVHVSRKNAAETAGI
jgi:hypothetical protein